MSKLIDLTGQKFGKWTVLERAQNYKSGLARWLCRCDCGREKIVYSRHLRTEASQQCRHCGSIKHGLYKIKLYQVWADMISRCKNPNGKYYKHYGGRGIKVCPGWRNDFMIFRRWALGHGYKHYLTIDRIDNDGDYEPSNCRFITMKKQNRNQSNNRLITINGVTKTLIEYAEQAGINWYTLRYRIDAGWPEYRLLEPTVK